MSLSRFRGGSHACRCLHERDGVIAQHFGADGHGRPTRTNGLPSCSRDLSGWLIGGMVHLLLAGGRTRGPLEPDSPASICRRLAIGSVDTHPRAFVFRAVGASSTRPSEFDGPAARMGVLVPPLWFLGLDQFISGNHDPYVRRLAARAVVGTAGAFLVATTTYIWSYGRHRARMIEGPAGDRNKSRSRVQNALDRLLSVPQEQAIFSFVTRTLVRSRNHRFVAAAFLALGFAICSESMAARSGLESWPSSAHLHFPCLCCAGTDIWPACRSNYGQTGSSDISRRPTCDPFAKAWKNYSSTSASFRLRS